GPVLGRKQQMLKLKGTTVYPPAIFEVLNGEKVVREYIVEAVSGSLGTDELKIHVLVDTGHEASVHAQLQARFQSTLRVVPEVVFTDQRSLQALNESGTSRKVRRFIDSRL